jgi:hypothetical protein
MKTRSRRQRHWRNPPNARDSSFADLGGEHRAKSVPPEPHSLVADVDPTLRQEILDVAQRELGTFTYIIAPDGSLLAYRNGLLM